MRSVSAPNPQTLRPIMSDKPPAKTANKHRAGSKPPEPLKASIVPMGKAASNHEGASE
jgi:hypothetical protein